MIDVSTFVGALTTLVAAFAGSWFAYKFSDRDRKRQLEDAQVAAANRAIFTLMRQFNTLTVFKERIIAPKRADALRLLNMRATAPMVYEDVHVDLDALTFLLETEHREVLGELMVEDERFHATIQAINMRSKLFIEVVQPILVAAGVREGDEATPAAVETMLGYVTYRELQRATDQAISFVDSTLGSSQAMALQLRGVFRKLYPKRTFIRFTAKGTSPGVA